VLEGFRTFVRLVNGCDEWAPTRYKAVVKFRLGLLTGFALGYYFGAKAGRERYEQIRRFLNNAREGRTFEKAQAAVELGLERIRQQPFNGTSASSIGQERAAV
jgi:hypothetical protein